MRQLQVRKSELVEWLGKKDQNFILDAILSRYKRYMLSEDDNNDMLEAVAVHLSLYKVEIMFNVYGEGKIVRNIMSIKKNVDRYLESVYLDYYPYEERFYSNLIYTHMDEDCYYFTVVFE